MAEVIRARRTETSRAIAERLGIHPVTVRANIAEERGVYEERLRKHRELVAQYRRDGATIPEIATLTDMSVTAVKVMLHRIRRAGGLDDVPLGQRGKSALLKSKQKRAQGKTKSLRDAAPDLIVHDDDADAG